MASSRSASGAGILAQWVAAAARVVGRILSAPFRALRYGLDWLIEGNQGYALAGGGSYSGSYYDSGGFDFSDWWDTLYESFFPVRRGFVAINDKMRHFDDAVIEAITNSEKGPLSLANKKQRSMIFASLLVLTAFSLPTLQSNVTHASVQPFSAIPILVPKTDNTASVSITRDAWYVPPPSVTTITPAEKFQASPPITPTFNKNPAEIAEAFAFPFAASLHPRMSSDFGMRTLHLRSGRYLRRHHDGVDFAVPDGTPVGAVAGGEVVYAGWRCGYGYTTVIKSDVDGRELYQKYAHLKKILVRDGQKVVPREEIALSGHTGFTTGPNLHYELDDPNLRSRKIFGTPIDPMSIPDIRTALLDEGSNGIVYASYMPKSKTKLAAFHPAI